MMNHGGHGEPRGTPVVSHVSSQFSVLSSVSSALRSDFFRIPRIPRFPLLVKDLTEAAARKRTYIIRVLFAVAAFLFFAWFYGNESRRIHESGMVLGRGAGLFQIITQLQLLAVALLTPGMAAGALTQEKERGTLALLFMTDLRPWEIVLEKYFSRLIPVFMFLLLTLPLLALSYSLGGVSTWAILLNTGSVVVTLLQLGAIGLAVSAWCRTSAGAFVAAYLVGAVVTYLLPWPFVWMNMEDVATVVAQPALITWLDGWQYAELGRLQFITAAGSIVIFLVLARVFLVRRAFAAPMGGWRRLLVWLNSTVRISRSGKRVWLARPDRSLPQDDPVFWRSISNRILNRFGNLAPTALAVSVPFVIIALIIGLGARDAGRGNIEGFTVLGTLLWAGAALFIGVIAATPVAGERTDQTLDLLLTTPLEGRDILRQKMRAVGRLLWLIRAPILAVGILEFLFEWPNGAGDELSAAWANYGDIGFSWTSVLSTAPFVQLLTALGSAVILPSLFAWAAFAIGLCARTRTKAIVIALAALAIWCAGPVLVLYLGRVLDIFNSLPSLTPLVLLAPLSMPVIAMTGHWEPLVNGDVHGWTFGIYILAANFVFYGLAALLLRHICLRHADKHLGRAWGEVEETCAQAGCTGRLELTSAEQ